MDPFGHNNHHRHHHHHHHERRDDDDEYDNNRRGNEFGQPPPPRPPQSFYDPPSQYPPPPPSSFYPPPPQPFYPPPQVSHVSHSSSIPPQHEGYGGGGGGYVPPNTSFGQHPESGTHHSYNPGGGGGGGYVPPIGSFGQQPESGTHHSYNPFHHHDQSGGGGGGGRAGGGLDLHNRPTYRVYCKANPDFHLTIRDGQVVLARSDPSDHFQDWFKDEKFSTKVKDEEGSPCFSLVNKATGQSMKHSVGAGHPVHLVSYNPDTLDESVLWTLSKDFGDGYRTMRMVNNVHLNVDAFHGDKKSGGVHDGTTIVLWKWNKGDNQLWKVVPNPR